MEESWQHPGVFWLAMGCNTIKMSDFIFRHGVIDLGFLGYTYIWSNKREGLLIIKEMVHQAICGVEW